MTEQQTIHLDPPELCPHPRMLFRAEDGNFWLRCDWCHGHALRPEDHAKPLDDEAWTH